MILEETLNKFMRDVINTIVGSAGYAIKAKQNAPRPNRAYATVDVMNSMAVGWEETKKENDPDGTTKVQFTNSGVREITFSLNFLKTSAVDNARKVHLGLARESIRSLFWAADLGLGRRSDVREISSALEDKWEERAQLDVTLHTTATDVELIESIGSLRIGASYEFSGDEHNFNIDIGDIPT